MFPYPSSRLRLALGRGLGVAIEFATLGEYGLPLEAAGAEPPPSAGAPSAQPGHAVRPSGTSSEVAAHGPDLDGAPGWARSSPGAAAAVAAVPVSAPPAPCERPRGDRPRRRPGRARRSSPPPVPQPCLTAEAASAAGRQSPP